MTEVASAQAMVPKIASIGHLGTAGSAILGAYLFSNVAVPYGFLFDGLAQSMEMGMDCTCMYRGEDRKAMALGRDEKAKRRRKNCGPYDLTRGVLFVAAPMVLGFAIDGAIWFPNWADQSLANFWATVSVPRNFALASLTQNLLQVFVNLPVSFLLHHKPINSKRFATSAGLVTLMRLMPQIVTLIRGRWAWGWFIETQVLISIGLSWLLYWENPNLEKPLWGRSENSDPEPYYMMEKRRDRCCGIPFFFGKKNKDVPTPSPDADPAASPYWLRDGSQEEDLLFNFPACGPDGDDEDQTELQDKPPAAAKPKEASDASPPAKQLSDEPEEELVVGVVDGTPAPAGAAPVTGVPDTEGSSDSAAAPK